MWEKSWERWRGWRENPQLLLGLVGIYTFCDIWMLEVGRKTVQDFHVLVTKCWRKKNSSANQLGANYPDPGIPKEGQEDGFKPTNTSETLPGELKGGYWKTNRTNTPHSNMKQVCSDTRTYFYTSSVSCRKIYKCRFWEASLYTRKPQPASDNRP